MKTLVTPQVKLTNISLDRLNVKPKDQLNNLKAPIGLKFYQKLFIVFLGLSIFLIFPESPQDSDRLCKKYNSEQICNVW